MPAHESPPVVAGRARTVFWFGLATAMALLAWAGRARPQWPWLSLWLGLLLGGLAVLSLPRVRRSLSLSWFGVTLFTLTGVCLANLFLFYVESHRQRSERLEVPGVWFEPSAAPLQVGVGVTGLDVRLEGDIRDLDRWSLRLAAVTDSTFVIDQARGVEMIRVRRGPGGLLRSRGRRSVLGHTLTRTSPLTLVLNNDSSVLRLEAQGRRGYLEWGGARASLEHPDPILDRILEQRLRAGIPLAELAWGALPDRIVGEDLVLTMVRPERSLGRLHVRLPTYRVVSRRDPDLGPDGVGLARGDTVWVSSRGRSWAFAVDRVPGLSRVSPPLAVRFVQGPRPTGWALPSAEACGSAVNRCGLLSSGPLPAPQAHFDVSGFGLDTARYAVLARLETERDQARLVAADEIVPLPYGEVRTLSAEKRDARAPDAGLLLRVHRAASARQSAVLLTVLGLYLLFTAALLVLLGNPSLARQLRTDAPTPTAAWSLLNLFLIFLGVRLALGLRVAYAAPFYDRAAATAVGLWIAFATLLVLLGRWSAWTPTVWRVARVLERPIRARLLPGVSEATRRELPGAIGTGADSGRNRPLSVLAWVVFIVCAAALVWQRPEAGLGLVAAVVGVLAWVGLGLFGRTGPLPGQAPRPIDVLTADAQGSRPLRTFGMAATSAMVLALTIQAPVVALLPVLGGLALFLLALALERGNRFGSPTKRAGALFVLVALVVPGGAWLLLGTATLPTVLLAASMIGLGGWLARGPAGGERRVLVAYRSLLEVGRSALSGIGWIGVVLTLAGLTFLNFQTIPPVVRFALVFLLFLLAVRAGLACRRVLDEGDSPLSALALLVIPVGVLLVFMVFDFGLGLVFFLPMMATVLLATRIDRLPRSLVAASLAVLLVVSLAAISVLRPSLGDLREAGSVAEYSRAFGGLGNGFVDALRRVGLGTPVTRATVRGLAASDPALVEEALAYAGPSEALLAAAPSLEQVWGGRAYATAGWTGAGLAGMTALGRGVPTVVSYAENAFSVYVLAEHGALGGLAVLLLYLALIAVVALWVLRVRATVGESPDGLAALALTVGSALWLTLPAAYVAASNLGLVPLTGQNMPFLGLNSWADVVLVSGIGTAVFVGLAGLSEEGAR